MLQTFHFLRPEWLLAIPVIIVLLMVAIRRANHTSGWEKVCDPALLQYQLSQQEHLPSPATRLLHWIIPFVFLVAVIALAGPAWEKKEQPIFQQEKALVIILDLSLSMNAEDIKPSRLERAKLKIIDILEQKKEGQTALIAFAGDAHTVSPLTVDNKTIMSLLPALDTSIMPLSGSHIIDALDTAKQLLKNSGFAKGNILLLSDGIDRSQESKLEDHINALYQQGYRFSVIGVGSQAGSPIPLPDQGGFVKDTSGQVVLSKLSDAPLKHLSQIGGGSYRPLSLDDSDFKTVLDDRLLDNDALVAQDNQLEQWVDTGAYITLLLIPLALTAFRKGLMSITIMLVFIPLFISEPAMANDSDKHNFKEKWHNLWSTPDQQAQKAFRSQDYEKAAEKFTHKNWKASSYYKGGDFAKAIEQYEQSSDADSLYNKANALANLQKFQEAINTYNEALKINPQLDDATKNRDYLKQLLAQQEQQPDQNPNQQQEDKSDKQSENQDQQQQQQQNDSEKGSQKSNSESSQSEQNSDDSEDSNTDAKDSGQETAQNNEAQENDATDNSNPKQTAQQSKPAESDKPQEIKPPVSEQSAEQMTQSQQQEENNQAIPQDTEANDVLSQLSQEEQQSLKQWLQRIPDNPGELLRIKFRNNSLLKQRQEKASPQYKGNPW